MRLPERVLISHVGVGDPWTAVASGRIGMSGVKFECGLVGPARQQFQGADFDNPVEHGSLPGRLQVEHDERPLQLDVLQHDLTSIELGTE